MSSLDEMPAEIAEAFAEDFLDATLTRTAPTRGAQEWDPPTGETVTAYPCKAIHDSWSASWLANGLVGADEVRILVLAATLSVEPQPGDRITIRGETFTIVPAGSGKPAVATDPAKATWELRAGR